MSATTKVDNDASDQEKARLEARDKAAADAKENEKTDENKAAEVAKAREEGTVGDELIAATDGGKDKVQLGVDGKTPVDFFNPAPKALLRDN